MALFKDQLLPRMAEVARAHPRVFAELGYYDPSASGLCVTKAASGGDLLRGRMLLAPLLRLFPSATVNHKPMKEVLQQLLRENPALGISPERHAGAIGCMLAHLRRIKSQGCKWRQATRFMSSTQVVELKDLCDIAFAVPWGDKEDEAKAKKSKQEAKSLKHTQDEATKGSSQKQGQAKGQDEAKNDIWSTDYDMAVLGAQASRRGGLANFLSASKSKLFEDAGACCSGGEYQARHQASSGGGQFLWMC